MAKILKNNTVSDIFISDVGVNILASSNLILPPQDYPLWAASSDVITFIGSGDITVNDGTFDLSKADGVAILQGNFKQVDFIESLKDNGRLKVEVLNTGGPVVQVTGNDQTSGYLGQKLVGKINKIETLVLNPGASEQLEVNIGNDVFDKTVDTTDDITEGVINLYFTNERAQDAVGSIFVDSSSVDLTYNDVSNTVSATVIPGGVDHALLSNLNSSSHFHLTQTQYTDLTDAGDSALHFHSSDRNRANHTGTQLSSTISDFTEATQDAVGNSLVDSSSVDFTYNDVGNSITAAVLPAGVNHALLNNLNSSTHFHLTQTEYTDLTDSGDSSLHFHSSDRNRTNHTGTQLATTISDFNEAAQDAVGNILTDTASVDFTYNDAGNSISAVVLPAGIDHNSLANLTTGDPHTQYVKDAGTVTDNAIVRYDTTDGRTIQNSLVTVDDSGNVITPGKVSVSTTQQISELTVQSTQTISNRGITTVQYSNDINGAKIILAKARGTPSTPLYPINSDVIGLLNFKAWDEATAAWSNVGYYNANASENHTASAKGTNISFWTTTNGTTTPTEKVSITNTGRVVLTNAITLSNTTETVAGTYRWTGTEAQVSNGTEWKVLGLNATSLTSTTSVSTTSNTYAIVTGMQTTPAAGTYLLSFNCNAAIGSDTNGDIAVFVGGTEQIIFTRRLLIDAAGLVGATATMETVFSTISFVTVNGSQRVDIRYRENGSGQLTITERVLTLIPAARPF